MNRYAISFYTILALCGMTLAARGIFEAIGDTVKGAGEVAGEVVEGTADVAGDAVEGTGNVLTRRRLKPRDGSMGQAETAVNKKWQDSSRRIEQTLRPIEQN